METTTTYRFEEVSVRGEKSGKCACGKRLKRAEKFMQTLSPFNRNKATGELKTYAEIMDEITAKRDAWLKEPVRCYGNCSATQAETGK